MSHIPTRKKQELGGEGRNKTKITLTKKILQNNEKIIFSPQGCEIIAYLSVPDVYI